MLNLLKQELSELLAFLQRNYNELIVIFLATLFLILNKYNPIGARWTSHLIYFTILPLISIIILLRKNPLDFGLKLGNYKIWGFYVFLTFLIAFPIIYFASKNSSISNYYTKRQIDFLKYTIEMSVIPFSWEFLFRGFLLFGLKDKFKEGSILIQMIPFALMHMGKPEIETLSCLITGIYFGYIVYRGGSYWPAFIIHMFINLSNRIIINFL